MRSPALPGLALVLSVFVGAPWPAQAVGPLSQKILDRVLYRARLARIGETTGKTLHDLTLSDAAGRAQRRKVTLGSGTVEVSAPRVNDRRTDESGRPNVVPHRPPDQVVLPHVNGSGVRSGHGGQLVVYWDVTALG